MAQHEIQGLNSKHLGAGSPEPPAPAPGKIRLYNMRFCQYGCRALLGLRLKNIPFEVININLVQKPEWYLKKNPLGKVPLIEHDGKLVYESLVCVDYSNDILKSGRHFISEDPYERARQRMLTERLTALPEALFPFYRNLQDPIHIKKVEDGFQLYESLLQNDYFAGNEPGYADFMSWPWLDILGGVEIVSEGRVVVTKDKYPKLAAYIERMRQIPQLEDIRMDNHAFAKFVQSYIQGNPDYDILAK